MEFKFKAHGHPNITSSHAATLEFTKDYALTKEGDCIIGTNSDFDFFGLKFFIKKMKNEGKKEIKMIIMVNSLKEEIRADINPDFDDEMEIVVRKGEFVSKRTLAIYADKAAADLSKEIISKIKNKNQEICVSITDL